MGKAYIISAALSFFGMENIDDKPTKHHFPNNLLHFPLGEKKLYFNVLGKCIDQQYLLQKHLDENYNDPDHIKNYRLCSIFLTILISQMKDTTTEGDGERNLINQKLLLSIFKSLVSRGVFKHCSN